MCGIAGFLSPPAHAVHQRSTIENMLAMILHRGPDQVGLYIDDRAALGTTRLSIIDVASGTQPLGSDDERYWICYNGELYNYVELRQQLRAAGMVFHTQSDTEVVLKAWQHWGQDCLPRFNGAFGFAVYDRQEQALFLARDRFGKRPLFYTEQDGVFAFASEMKAFLAHPSLDFAFDPAVLASIFATWAPFHDQTPFRGIYQVPGGHWRMLKNGVASGGCYAPLQLTRNTEHAIDSQEQACERIRQAMHESVRLRMRSDVEIGVYLSGGLDSAIVTSLVTSMSAQPVRTFSVEFEDGEFDESGAQQEVSRHFGTQHAALRIKAADIADNFHEAVYHAEVPVFRTAFVPMFLLSAKVQQSGVKVVMSGEGADEAFLGYGIFGETLLLSNWKELSDADKIARLRQLYPYYKHLRVDDAENDHAALLGLYQQFSEPRNAGLFSHEMRFQNGLFATRLLNQRGDALAALKQRIAEEPGYDALTPVQQAQWLEFHILLSGYLLSSQGERMALGHGVENRCPFLDPAVVALAADVNLQFDDGFNEKYLLKQAFKDVLPASITARHKFPYRAPESAPFVACPTPQLQRLLSGEALALPGLDCLNPAFVKSLLKKIMTADSSTISTRENQSFIFLLSLVSLQELFVQRGGLALADNQRAQQVLARVVDKRSASEEQMLAA